MKFWLTRTVKTVALVEAPTEDAAFAYSNSDAFADYAATTSGGTTDTIVSTATTTAPDVTIDEDGREVEEEED